jgi:Leucine-rich repeat (LRR) protein
MESDKSLNIAFVESFGFAESLDIIGCNFTNLKDVSALQNLKSLSISNPKNLTIFPLLGENKNLNKLSITAPNLTDLKGIGQCTNLKTISLSNNKNLNTVESLENIKFVDIGLSWSGIKNLDFLENTQIISSYNHSIGYNEALDIHEGAFSVSSDRSDEDKKKTGKGLPDGFDTNGYVIPEFYEDGSSSDFINQNTFYLNDCPNLEQVKGLKNVTNIMALDFRNCVNLTSLDGLEKMLDLREIDLTGCTNLESIHALKNCSKLEKIMVAKCDNIKPKPKVKNMDTLEKVQEYLAKL